MRRTRRQAQNQRDEIPQNRTGQCGPTTTLVMASGKTIPPPIIFATAVEKTRRHIPSTPAYITAAKGLITLVDTTVATAFAQSCQPFENRIAAPAQRSLRAFRLNQAFNTVMSYG